MKYYATQDKVLLDVLAFMSPDSSKTTLRSWLKNDRVLVDGVAARDAKLVVGKGQEVEIGAKPVVKVGGIKILYEDNDIVVIDKPVGLLSVATDFDTENTAHAILKKKYRPRRVHVVHRLDQDTSGVMLFALSDKARQSLKSMFEKHDLVRCYVAIVEGKLERPSGSWHSRLIEEENFDVHSTDDPKLGRDAITHFRRITANNNYSMLELTLETGRKHQIRVQCSDSGHPVVGDTRYGSKRNPIRRMALHSHRIAMLHPVTGQKMSFVSPVPASFHKIIDTRGGAHA